MSSFWASRFSLGGDEDGRRGHPSCQAIRLEFNFLVKSSWVNQFFHYKSQQKNSSRLILKGLLFVGLIRPFKIRVHNSSLSHDFVNKFGSIQHIALVSGWIISPGIGKGSG
jgi:hypothetical protein